MRLKELRKQRKLKQIDVAEVLNCSQGVYSRYESSDREPPFDIIKKLADFYGVTVDYLMGVDTEPPTEPVPVPKEMTPAERRAEAKQLIDGMDEEQYLVAIKILRLIKGGKE